MQKGFALVARYPELTTEVGMRYSATSVMLPELTMEEQAALLQKLGYDGIEWRVRRITDETRKRPLSEWGLHKNDLTPENFASNADRMKRVAADDGIAIAGIASAATADDIEQVKLLVEGARACGAPFVRVGCPRRYEGDVPYPVLYNEAVDAFGKLLDAIAGYGVKVGVEIHGGTIHTSASLTHRIISHWSPDRICAIYDPQNMVSDGYETTEMALELLDKYVGHVHAGGHRPEPKGKDDTGTAQWEWPGVPMADGLYSFPRMLRKMKAMGYPHFISVEDFRSIPVEAKLKEGIDYLRAVEANV
jgi:sugar phosphate isomerase/epimerase